MPVFTDQLNRDVYLSSTPRRIISVVPSQTELLYYLGLDEEVIGITKFCVHPGHKFKLTPKIGGTKQLNLDKIRMLQPDLIIANKEENERSQVEALMEICPVWISDISDLTGAVDMISKIGYLVGKEERAGNLTSNIIEKFKKLCIPQTDLKVACFIWQAPYMVAGKNTFIDSMLHKCGLINAFDIDRYPEINAGALKEVNPDVVLLSSEPYPFKDKHIAEFKELLPSAIIKLVDGELFSWYGSRLLHAPAYFEQLMTGITGNKKN